RGHKTESEVLIFQHKIRAIPGLARRRGPGWGPGKDPPALSSDDALRDDAHFVLHAGWQVAGNGGPEGRGGRVLHEFLVDVRAVQGLEGESLGRPPAIEVAAVPR